MYISQLIRFVRVCSRVEDFYARNKLLTAKLLKQGHRYQNIRKAFSKFYRRHYEMISKFDVGLKSLLHQCLSEPEFYGDLVYIKVGVAQWLERRISDQGVHGSNPGRCTFRCGLEQVTFTLLSTG